MRMAQCGSSIVYGILRNVVQHIGIAIINRTPQSLELWDIRIEHTNNDSLQLIRAVYMQDSIAITQHIEPSFLVYEPKVAKR